MDAKPLLVEIGRGLEQVNLEAVLIGNAAAALQGAPVTTIDTATLRVASLEDIVRSKRAAGRARDLAVLAVLERALEATTQSTTKARGARKRKRTRSS